MDAENRKNIATDTEIIALLDVETCNSLCMKPVENVVIEDLRDVQVSQIGARRVSATSEVGIDDECIDNDVIDDDYEPDNGNSSTDSQEEEEQCEYVQDEIEKQDGFHNLENDINHGNIMEGRKSFIIN